MSAEFDRYAPSYSRLLRDPIRDRFAGDSAFFHLRKWMLIREFLAQQQLDPSALIWLDAGCGQGDLLKLAGRNFARAVGCDPSREMISLSNEAEMHQQLSLSELPFSDCCFDLVTAVCVYHHIQGRDRTLLTESIQRVLKPGGLFCMIEHNPWNPVTQLVVKRCPVDRDAELLTPSHAAALFRSAGLKVVETWYFLYFPQQLFRHLGGMERYLRRLALGGQFAVFGRRPGSGQANS